MLIFVALTVGAHAQSTDPTHPTPWPATGASGPGGDSRITYYYSVLANAGNMTVRTQARAQRYSTSVTLDFADESGTNVGRAGVIAFTDPASGEEVIRLSAPHTLLVAIHLEENLGAWSVRINPPPRITRPATLPNGNPVPPLRPATGPATTPGTPGEAARWSSYGVNYNGDGADHVHTYILDAGAGDITIHVETRARRLSTAVTAGLYDGTGNLVREIGAIATDRTVHESGTIHIDTRQTFTLRVRSDENVGPYSVWIDGAVHR